MRWTDDRGCTYNTNGIRTKTRFNLSLWSSDYLDVFADRDTYDPFEQKEEERAKEVKAMRTEALMAILPAVIGLENYMKYRLHQVECLSSETIGEYYGVSGDAIRKTSERTRKKIESIVNSMLECGEVETIISQLAFDLRERDKEIRHTVNTDETDYNFNFSQMEKEYYKNMKDVEKELGIGGR